VTRAVRTPSRIEDAIISTAFAPTIVAPIPVFLRITGNPSFQAERLIGYEVGYRARMMGQSYLDIAAFHDAHHGLSSFGLGTVTIEATPAPIHGVVNVLYVNGVSGSSNGFELSPEWQARKWWQLRGSYSYVQFDLANTPGSIDVNAVARYSGSSPHHKVRAQSQMNLPLGSELDLTYRYVSDLPAQLVPAYHTADARIGWSMSPTVALSVAGQNLLAPSHAEFGHGSPTLVGIARSIYMELRWSRAPGRP
jgi:iron complex outermembrane receptor protein